MGVWHGREIAFLFFSGTATSGLWGLGFDEGRSVCAVFGAFGRRAEIHHVLRVWVPSD